MKTYPYIGKSKHGNNYLFTSINAAYSLINKSWMPDASQLIPMENITREYLANTYGEVVSPEHAEFIIELAELHGFEVADDDYEKRVVIEKYCKGGELVYFYTWKNSRGQAFIAFSKCKDTACNDGEKQITIPLPPKADSKKWTPDFYELGELPKHFDCVCNKCGGKCCTGQCDKEELSEWPQVGDEVMFTDLLQHYDKYRDEYCNKVSKVIARFNTTEGEFIKVHREYCAVMTVRVDRVLQDGALIKPKTTEEELRDDIVNLINYAGSFSAQIIAGYLMSKYDIKKKTQ